jgi:hypothetical protein
MLNHYTEISPGNLFRSQLNAVGQPTGLLNPAAGQGIR